MRNFFANLKPLYDSEKTERKITIPFVDESGASRLIFISRSLRFCFPVESEQLAFLPTKLSAPAEVHDAH